jgi:hypothetical protein
MHKKLTDMKPVDDFVTRNTPGLKIWEENWGGMQCAYHVFAPGTDFTDILKGKGLEHDLCGVEHWAYVLKGTLEVIYLDGSVDVCTAGECCYWPAPHNFKSKEGAEILQFSTAGGLAASQENPGVHARTDEGHSLALGHQTIGARCFRAPDHPKGENKMKLKTRNPRQIAASRTPAVSPFHGMGAFVGTGKDAEGPCLHGGIHSRRDPIDSLQEDRRGAKLAKHSRWTCAPSTVAASG